MSVAPAVAEVWFKEIEGMAFRQGIVLDELSPLNDLFVRVFEVASQAEGLQFHTFYSRVAWVCHRYGASDKVRFLVQAFRAGMKMRLQGTPTKVSPQLLYRQGIAGLALLLEQLSGMVMPARLAEQVAVFAREGYHPVAGKPAFDRLRMVALGRESERVLKVAVQELPGPDFLLDYSGEGAELFGAVLDQLGEAIPWPVTLSCFKITREGQQLLRPGWVVVQPDFLVDVSGVAACFDGQSVSNTLGQIARKFLPRESTPAIVLGNLVNYALDELLHRPDLDFQTLKMELFRQYPLVFASWTNEEVGELVTELQRQFSHLQQVLWGEFPQAGIYARHCVVEPTFFSEWYGLQGRLDLLSKVEGAVVAEGQDAVGLFAPEEKKPPRNTIVELKSGKVFRPNVYGISASHFSQLGLYDLLVKSTFGAQFQPLLYILYSRLPQDALRYGPPVQESQAESLAVRNELVLWEGKLRQEKPELPGVWEAFVNAADTAQSFADRDRRQVAQVFERATGVEKAYVKAFTGFISREMYLAKTGVEGSEQINGLASIWLDTDTAKIKRFGILTHLVLTSNASGEADPVLEFSWTDKTPALVNFRVGDIVLLYRTDARATRQQLYRANIVSIHTQSISVRLRSRQAEPAMFEGEQVTWNMEPDQMDTGFNAMYQGLYQLVQGDEADRKLFLGQRAPEQVNSMPEVHSVANQYMTEEQKMLLQKMLQSPEYFLLWGPPGTGKTNVMLQELVRHLLNETDEKILLLAYTNRAVDEMCESIERIDQLVKKQYFRIGSRFSTAPEYHDQLLDSKLKNVQKRSELQQLLHEHRIVLATVASFTGKLELLQLMQFDRVVVDEASQILEPVLAGLLPKFPKWILIGDHYQLPAVVAQPERDCLVAHEGLNALGIRDLRASLFERLYRRAQDKNWHWAYGQLSHQGRMHDTLMAFPNEHFYQNKLKVMPGDQPWQLQPLPYTADFVPGTLEHLLCTRRVLYFHTPVEWGRGVKYNQSEAEQVVALIRAFKNIYDENGRDFQEQTLGVITPWRAQIACIRAALEKEGLGKLPVTVDTVERYQGGARDIILLSVCVNDAQQLEQVISLSADRMVDRKLNVAVTRARQQLVVLGNPELLRQNAWYAALMTMGFTGNSIHALDTALGANEMH